MPHHPMKQPTNDLSAKHSIPGKIFIVGEYAVLSGLPAVVAAVGPRFATLSGRQSQGESEITDFAQASPVGRLLKSGSYKNTFHFEDPWQGSGGFGASTAQFSLVLKHLIPGSDWKMAWTLYRKLISENSEGKIIPSGADLVAQWQGGVQLFSPGKTDGNETTRDVYKNLDWSRLLVFSATQIKDRKVATHTHLDTLAMTSFSDLGNPLMAAVNAIDQGDVAKLGQCLTNYAEALAAINLESPDAHADRLALTALPGVLGVKGAGALQSDAMIVLCDVSAERAMIISTAESRGLKLVCNGLPYEKGLLDE